MYEYYSTLQHSGIESMTLHFAWGTPRGGAGWGMGAWAWGPCCSCTHTALPHPPAPSHPARPAADTYPEHLKTKGYNAIALMSVTNCWVTNVRAGAGGQGGEGCDVVPTCWAGRWWFSGCLRRLPCKPCTPRPRCCLLMPPLSCLLAAPPSPQINIINADNGVQVGQSDFVTVFGVSLAASLPRYTQSTFGNNGHHALWVGRSGDVAFFG